jgi:hypothetical protein
LRTPVTSEVEVAITSVFSVQFSVFSEEANCPFCIN